MTSQDPGGAQQLLPEVVQKLEVVKIEKNLNSFGFFSPSTKGLDTKKSKTVAMTREERGRRIQAKATIFPSPDHGLPTTADQDKYLAFQRIVTDLKKRTGSVTNPIGFTSYQLLKILGLTPSGKNYEDVIQWLERMTLTGIRSENVVYFAGRKVWAKDIFHVFERVAVLGQELPDGRKADQNYVWLSEWQLENINNNYVLPVDLVPYRQLRSNISKALVPMLQIWFYASQRKIIEKRYSDLCQHLNCRRWLHLSKIKANFTPALDELKLLGFLESWEIQRTVDKEDYKIILAPGDRYSRDSRLRLAGQEPVEDPVSDPDFAALIDALTNRGIREDRARQLLLHTTPNQRVLEQLEWGDHLIRSAGREKFFNPAGFFIYLIQKNIEPPPYFRPLRQPAVPQQRSPLPVEADTTQLMAEEEYKRYRDLQITQYLENAFKADELQAQIRNAKRTLAKEFASVELWPEDEKTRVALQMIKQQVVPLVPMMSYEEFSQQQQRRLF